MPVQDFIEGSMYPESAPELLKLAIKSEIEAARVYFDTAERVDNFALKDRLILLGKEEAKHRIVLEKMYYNLYNAKPPNESELAGFKMPMDMVITADDSTPIPMLLENAMIAEKNAENFYIKLQDRIENRQVRSMLEYLAHMEKNHYKLLNIEYELLMQFPDFYGFVENDGLHMEHVGP